MSKRMGKTFFAWGAALMFLAAASSSARVAQHDHASPSGAKSESVVLAAIGAPAGRPASSLAAKSQASQEGLFPVLFWKLLDPGFYIYRYNMKGLDWRQIRERRDARQNAGKSKKDLKLYLTPLSAGSNAPQTLSPDLIKQVCILMRDPDGNVSQLKPGADHEEIISIPHGKEINGRYLLSAQLNLGEIDCNQDGRKEKVCLYAKQFVLHYQEGLTMGSRPDVFFNDLDQVALEIGPVVINAKNKFGGGIQWPHREYEMMVKYKGRPLPGAKVSVYVEGGGWQGRFITGVDGVFTIMPTDDRFGDKTWQNYIYVAEHFDARDRSYHIASLPVIINRNQAEWRSKAMGFGFWSIVGSALTLLLVAGLSWRRRCQDKKSLVVFESCRIKKD